MKRIHVALLLAVALAGLAFDAAAEVKTKVIEYQQGDATLEGVLTWDDAKNGPRPAVLVVHQWKGLGEYEKKRSAMLASLGFVVFAADIYGKGIRPSNPKDAAAMAGKFKSDRALLRARVNAGLAVRRTWLERVRQAVVMVVGAAGCKHLEPVPMSASGADFSV